MKIGIVVIFWNEWHLLSTQLLSNLEEKLTEWPQEDVVFIDAFFDQMARWETPRQSDDDSIELLTKKGYEVIHAQGNMLDICNMRYEISQDKGWDALLWLDSDEYITGDIEKFKQTVEILCQKYDKPTRINVSFKDWNKIYDYNITPQLLIHPSKCMQKFGHIMYFNRETGERLVPKQTVIDITINHDDTLRPDSRDRLNNSFSVVNGRIEKMNINNAITNKDPWLTGMSVLKND